MGRSELFGSHQSPACLPACSSEPVLQLDGTQLGGADEGAEGAAEGGAEGAAAGETAGRQQSQLTVDKHTDNGHTG